MRLYLDTSALVKLYVAETGSEHLRALLREARVVATSAIAYVEAVAAFSRKHSMGDVPAADYRRALRELDRDWEYYLRVEVNAALIREAAGQTRKHVLRAFDAVHLASALQFRTMAGGEVAFTCWDADLARAARREKFRLLPAGGESAT